MTRRMMARAGACGTPTIAQSRVNTSASARSMRPRSTRLRKLNLPCSSVISLTRRPPSAATWPDACLEKDRFHAPSRRVVGSRTASARNRRCAALTSPSSSQRACTRDWPSWVMRMNADCRPSNAAASAAITATISSALTTAMPPARARLRRLAFAAGQPPVLVPTGPPTVLPRYQEPMSAAAFSPSGSPSAPSENTSTSPWVPGFRYW